MVPSSIKSLIFEVTWRCNANCRYCYNVWKNEGAYPKGELSTRQIKKLLSRALKETNAYMVTLTGGEPLIRKDLEEIVKFLRGLRADVNVITNATLLDDKKIKRLVELGVSMFEVPLLSQKREVHNKLMRLDSFDLATEAIVKIKKYNGRVVAVFVATKENINDFRKMLELSFALGADGVMLNRFNPGGEGRRYIEELLPDPAQVEAALQTAEDFAEKYKFSIACSIPIQPCVIDTSRFKKLSFGFCAAGTERSYYTIDPLGNLRMCNHSQIILGNLFKEHFRDLIAKQAAANFVAASPEFCQKCRIKDSCLGGCKAAAEACFGSIKQEDPFLKRNKEQAVFRA